MLFIIGVIIFLFFLLCFNDIRLQIHYSLKNYNYFLRINISTIFGLIRFKITFPTNATLQKPKKKPIDPFQVAKDEKPVEEIGLIVNQILHFFEIGKTVIKHFRIHQLEWRSTIGTEDAAQTGMLVGLGWTVKGSIVGIISQHTRLQEKPILHIQPRYNQNIYETFFRCIVRIRLGYAMLAGIQYIRLWKRHMHFSKSENEVKKEDKDV